MPNFIRVEFEVDTRALPNLSEEEQKKLDAELEILRTIKIPRNFTLEKRLTDSSVILRRVDVSYLNRKEKQFYYRVLETASVGELSRNGYSSDEVVNIKLLS